MTLRWPKTLPKTSVMFHPAMASRSGGRSIAGTEQVTVSSSGFWRAKISFLVMRKVVGGAVRKQDSQLAWRAMLANLQGRSNAFLIGPCDHGNTPAYIAGDTEVDPLPHDDGTFFSDGTGYVQPATPAHVAGNYAAGSTSMIVNMLGGHTPEPGQYFSVGERMFLIKSAALYGGSLMAPFTPAYWQLSIWPEVREAISDGAWAEFDDPVCLMQFASDDTGELAIAKLQAASPSIDLVEASPQ